uniref:Uncharacterized protein n=1 Tax=Glossina palpalis gambiensis TaxID=67801 RepID=A0A1B0AX40_9MUSC
MIAALLRDFKYSNSEWSSTSENAALFVVFIAAFIVTSFTISHKRFNEIMLVAGLDKRHVLSFSSKAKSGYDSCYHPMNIVSKASLGG